jgi:IS4 transposase
MLSPQGNLPAWAAITEAHFPDRKILDLRPITPGACQVMDRGHLDFVRLFRVNEAEAFFVVRNKHHVKFRVIASRPVDKSLGLRCDQTRELTSPWSVKSCPKSLRRIRVYDAENKGTLVLLTNQFDLPAWVVAERYRKGWPVGLFFKWIKQPLRIRGFYGRSQNAVRCQIWPALCACLMAAIVKKQLQNPKTLNEILQIVSVNIFEQVPLAELLATAPAISEPNIRDDHFQNMLMLKD